MRFAAALAMLSAAPARAEPMYDVTLPVDGTALLLGWGFAALLEGVVKPSLPIEAACPGEPAGVCDPTPLNGLDRGVVGNDSKAWAAVGDIAAAAGPTLGILGAGLATYLAEGGTPADGLADAAVIAEAGLAATLATHALKYAIRRPRPSVYASGRSTTTADGRSSFPSGHTSSTAAFTTAAATTFMLRHPDSPWRFAWFGGAALLTAATAAGRVGAGKHFYTDVFGGALLGLGAGILVPLLKQRADVTVSMLPGGTQLVAHF